MVVALCLHFIWHGSCGNVEKTDAFYVRFMIVGLVVCHYCSSAGYGAYGNTSDSIGLAHDELRCGS